MANLTFTTTPPRKRTVHPNADLLDMVREAYQEHQAHLEALDRVDTERRRLRERIRNGEAWIQRHHPQAGTRRHPRYELNQGRLDALRHDLRENEWRTRDLKVARMGAAIDLWAAMAGLTELEQVAIRKEIRVDAVFRPDPERYHELIENWGQMSDVVEIPYQ